MSSLARASGDIKGVIVMINNLSIMSLREGASRVLLTAHGCSGANFGQLYKVFQRNTQLISITLDIRLVPIFAIHISN